MGNAVIGFSTNEEAKNFLLNCGIESLRKHAGFIPDVTNENDDTDYAINHLFGQRGDSNYLEYFITVDDTHHGFISSEKTSEINWTYCSYL